MFAFKGITHVLFGISLYIYFFGFNFLNLLFVVLGSLLPDIDHQHSLLGKFNPFARFMKHRGIMHTLLICIALFGLSLPYNLSYALSLGFGYLSHLIGDTLTVSGIMWLYPLNKKYYTLSPGNDLKGIEAVIFSVCIIYLFLGKIF